MALWQKIAVLFALRIVQGFSVGLAIAMFLIMTACSYQVPRTESGRIDERQMKRDIDVDITDKIRIDVENKELRFECRVKNVFCV